MLRRHPRGSRSTPTTTSIRTACSPATRFGTPRPRRCSARATAPARVGCYAPNIGGGHASQHDKIDRDRVVLTLNTILELELAGVVRYVHYSLMVFGHARIPIIG